MNTGVIGLLHDCAVCVSLIEEFGTCEYMHEANPSRCTCFLTAPRKRTNEQTVLQTASTDAARLRYWRHWSVTEGIRLGLTVLPDSTSTLSLAVEMSAATQTTLDVAALAVQPAEIKSPAGPHNREE